MIATINTPTAKPIKAALMRLLFPPWRMGNNVRSADDIDLKAGVERCVLLEIAFAGLVVAGVLGELWYPRAGTIVVAVGVAMETLFLGIGHFVQGELTERSDKQLGEAKERAAAAELEIARLRDISNWRGFAPLESESLTKLLKCVEPATVRFTVTSDPEARNFAGVLAKAFKDAGWATAFVQAGYIEEAVRETRIPSLPAPQAKFAEAVQEAFGGIGLPFSTEPTPEPFMTTEWGETPIPPVVDVYVGPRPAPNDADINPK